MEYPINDFFSDIIQALLFDLSYDFVLCFQIHEP